MSMIKRMSTYWLYQFFGWGMVVLTNLFFAYTLDKLDDKFLPKVLIYAALGCIFSHIMRTIINRSHILIKPIQQQIMGFIFITICFSFGLGFLEAFIFKSLDLLHKTADGKTLPLFKIVINSVFDSFGYLFIWNCIYYIYHYIEKTRRQELDTLKLEALVRELELKTIKSHINPHFIFNALNSIRALIDENPLRARTAITELSNILRSSMQTEKQETVFFEKELSIVKDYLALEHIRFEDRLNVQYEIAENTLTQQIPPMMLQTLVENAIKHGISKQVSGGTVTIVSRMKEHYHQLVIRNTGRLNNLGNEDGFGLTSTRNRLHLLFGEEANFNIREINGNMVEAELQIPFT